MAGDMWPAHRAPHWTEPPPAGGAIPGRGSHVPEGLQVPRGPCGRGIWLGFLSLDCPFSQPCWRTAGPHLWSDDRPD